MGSPSTRTRTSFELSEQRLSADIINFNTEASSLKKGESLKDTARNLEALNIDFIVIRHSAAGAPHFLTRCLDANILNAGDGSHEHPTQALLDMYTIREKFGKLDGLHVCDATRPVLASWRTSMAVLPAADTTDSACR